MDFCHGAVSFDLAQDVHQLLAWPSAVDYLISLLMPGHISFHHPFISQCIPYQNFYNINVAFSDFTGIIVLAKKAPSRFQPSSGSACISNWHFGSWPVIDNLLVCIWPEIELGIFSVAQSPPIKLDKGTAGRTTAYLLASSWLHFAGPTVCLY